MKKEGNNEYTDEGCHRTTKEPDRQNQLPVNLDFVWKNFLKIYKHTFFKVDMEKEGDNEYTDEGCHSTTEEPGKPMQPGGQTHHLHQFLK